MSKRKEFFDNLEENERESLLVFARLYMGEFLFEDGVLERVPNSLQKYYSNLWTKLDILVTRTQHE